MSKHNKVNPGQYHIGGRLTPDEAARERVKQREVGSSSPTPPRETKAQAARTGSKGSGAPARAKSAGAKGEEGASGAPRARAAGRSRS